MSYADKEKAPISNQQGVMKVRITITSTKVQKLEKVSADLVGRARAAKLTIRGPVRLPTKTLTITTRKTPNGNGSETWDRFEMRIHKRLIDMYAAPEQVKKVTSYALESGVEIEVIVAEK